MHIFQSLFSPPYAHISEAAQMCCLNVKLFTHEYYVHFDLHCFYFTVITARNVGCRQHGERDSHFKFSLLRWTLQMPQLLILAKTLKKQDKFRRYFSPLIDFVSVWIRPFSLSLNCETSRNPSHTSYFLKKFMQFMMAPTFACRQY